jgi:hypothetical protein
MPKIHYRVVRANAILGAAASKQYPEPRSRTSSKLYSVEIEASWNGRWYWFKKGGEVLSLRRFIPGKPDLWKRWSRRKR